MTDINLNIAGWSKLSTVDWVGNLTATLFLQGCPWRCTYCHNHEILDPNVKGEVQWNDVYEFMLQRVGLLDGIVFSGGEAILQANAENGGELLKAMQAIRSIPSKSNPNEPAFKIGLHTAGFWPEALRKVIREVDWVGFDIKAPNGKYDSITRVAGSEIKGLRSLGVILEEREFRLNTPRPLKTTFRTTIDPMILSHDDISHLQKQLSEKGITDLVLQEARTLGAPDEFTKALSEFYKSKRIDII